MEGQTVHSSLNAQKIPNKNFDTFTYDFKEIKSAKKMP